MYYFFSQPFCFMTIFKPIEMLNFIVNACIPTIQFPVLPFTMPTLSCIYSPIQVFINPSFKKCTLNKLKISIYFSPIYCLLTGNLLHLKLQMFIYCHLIFNVIWISEANLIFFCLDSCKILLLFLNLNVSSS